MKFVKTPYLPKGKVAVAVADLKREDILIVEPCSFLNLPQSLKKHADLSFCYLGEGRAVCAKGSFDYYKRKFENTPLHIIEGETAPDIHYPYDAAYNVAIVGKKMFCKVDTTDKSLLKEAEILGYKIINIRQGYSKCSVCPVDENSAITADISFYKKAHLEGIDTLLITNQTILLPGYNNGFFGGSAYMEDEKTLCVKGDLKTHPDYDKIMEFLKVRDIKIKSGKGNVFDFGSFIPIFEE